MIVVGAHGHQQRKYGDKYSAAALLKGLRPPWHESENTMTMRKQKPRKLKMAEARYQGLLNIGETSAASGISAKSIRHYESVGLIPPANRTYSNYRIYTQKDIQTLHFIRSARDLGFSVEQIKALLSLWQDHNRSSSDVKRQASGYIQELNQKIAELQSMRNTLHTLAQHRRGNVRPKYRS